MSMSAMKEMYKMRDTTILILDSTRNNVTSLNDPTIYTAPTNLSLTSILS